LDHEGGNMAEAKKEAKSSKPKAKNQAKKTRKADLLTETVSLENPPEAMIEIENQTEEPKLAKAGKRSAKVQRQEVEMQAKTERKAAANKSDKKETVKASHGRHDRAGKKYKEAYKLVDKNRTYSLTEAIELTLKTATTKFDSTVELHVNLGVDPKQADQNIRENLILPAGTGKSLRVAVFADGDQAKAALSAGADLAGVESLLAQLDKEEINFDVLISAPASMAQLGKYARLLGPRGLMPNPKSGTVTSDIAKAVSEAKAGKVEYRVDEAGIVHIGIGKVSFGASKIADNADAALASIKSAKPASLKGVYIKSAYLTTTMGPSVKVELP
jgi:large subunit ribosomal protein L1